MTRFFVDPDKINGKNIIIIGQDAVHALRVLRLKNGDQVIVCDGNGYDYAATIIST